MLRPNVLELPKALPEAPPEVPRSWRGVLGGGGLPGSKIPPQVPRSVRGGCGGELPGGSGKTARDCRTCRRGQAPHPMPQSASQRSPAFFPGGQPKATEGPAFLAGFVPDVLTGILLITQGFSEL